MISRLFPLLCAFTLVLPAHAANEEILDTNALTQLEQRAVAAQPRDQCFLYAELVHRLTEIVGRQVAAGESEKASATLQRIDALVQKIHVSVANDAKRLKNAEMILSPHHGTPYGYFARDRQRRPRSGAVDPVPLERRTVGNPRAGLCPLRFGHCLLLSLSLGICYADIATAQGHADSMTAREIDTLREASYIPADRIHAFSMILDTRARGIQEIVSKPRRPGRELQLHDLLQQFADIAAELNDNLDDLSAKHRDLRKALPKLLSSTERWATILRTPADDPGYKTVRIIATDTLTDLRTSVLTLQTEQTAYFLAHPEAARAEKERLDPAAEAAPKPFDVPR